MYNIFFLIFIIILLLEFSKCKNEEELKYISIDFYSKFPYETEKNYFHENIIKIIYFQK